jgi:histidinol-phosphate aminotransferase
VITGLTTGKPAAPVQPLLAAGALDRLINPYAPTPSMLRRINESELAGISIERIVMALRSRIADLHSVRCDWLILGNRAADLILSLCSWRRDLGRIAVFPPTDLAVEDWAANAGVELLRYRRALDGRIDRALRAPLSGNRTTAIVMSPNDPTGTALDLSVGAQLATLFDLLVVDERLGGYGARSLIPLCREFDNVIVIRSFEYWAGLFDMPVAYAVGQPAAIGHCRSWVEPQEWDSDAVTASLAAMSEIGELEAACSAVRVERGRLYRMLRKLNMIEPMPSQGSFVIANVAGGHRDFLYGKLLDRDIRVYRAPQAELPQAPRVSAVSPVATATLKRALVEISIDSDAGV